MSFWLPYRYTIFALVLFIIELTIFVMIGDAAGEIFHWKYRSLAGIYVWTIISLVAFALTATCFFSSFRTKPQKLLQYLFLFAPTWTNIGGVNKPELANCNLYSGNRDAFTILDCIKPTCETTYDAGQ